MIKEKTLQSLPLGIARKRYPEKHGNFNRNWDQFDNRITLKYNSTYGIIPGGYGYDFGIQGSNNRKVYKNIRVTMKNGPPLHYKNAILTQKTNKKKYQEVMIKVLSLESDMSQLKLQLSELKNLLNNNKNV